MAILNVVCRISPPWRYRVPCDWTAAQRGSPLEQAGYSLYGPHDPRTGFWIDLHDQVLVSTARVEFEGRVRCEVIAIEVNRVSRPPPAEAVLPMSAATASRQQVGSARRPGNCVSSS